MNSNSTKNINYKINESATLKLLKIHIKLLKSLFQFKFIIDNKYIYDNLTKNYNSIKNIKIKNTKNPINNINQKINQNKNASGEIKNQIPIQKNKNDFLSDKRKNLLNNKISNEENEKIINEEKHEIRKTGNKPKIEAPKHQKEKNSSISNYIFKEDYRIKEDIESNSNLNNFEETENNENKIVSKQNFS
jgi:hypothetical protein